MRASILFVLCWLTVQAVRADEPLPALTVDGVTYSNVTFGTVTPTRVGIIYSGGITSLPLEKLSPELQKRFGYDPQKASQYRQAEQDQRQKTAEQEAAKRKATDESQVEAEKRTEKCKEAKARTGKVMQVLPDGLLCYSDEMRFFLKGLPFPDAAEGNDVPWCWAYRDGTYTYRSVLGASTTVEQWVYCEPVTKWVDGYGGVSYPVRESQGKPQQPVKPQQKSGFRSW